MSTQKKIKIFCRNVRQRRTEMGLSLAELSERSGLPLNMLEALEQDVLLQEMMVEDSFSLAGVFGCEVEELFK